MVLRIIDEGLKDYGEMLEKQRRLFNGMVTRKKNGQPLDEEYIFLVEHNPVVTLGKHAKDSNVLLPEEILRQRGVGVFHIERGGDVTFHGPGQLVAYPLIDLEMHWLGVKDYVNLLEETVIRTIAAFGLNGMRISGASGVWIDAGTPAERKICALGVKCSRFITMHGLALNVNTDLSGFGLINPCGFIDKGVTSMKKEIGISIDINQVKESFKLNFKALLGID